MRSIFLRIHSFACSDSKNVYNPTLYIEFKSCCCAYSYNEYQIPFHYQLQYGTVIRTGITCKKIPCYMRDSACRWFIVGNAKIFRSYVKHF